MDNFLHLQISIHIYVDLYTCLGYTPASGAQIIRFSYATKNITPTGKQLHAGYVQKAEPRKHTS